MSKQNETVINEAKRLLEFAEETVFVPKPFVGKLELTLPIFVFYLFIYLSVCLFTCLLVYLVNSMWP